MVLSADEIRSVKVRAAHRWGTAQSIDLAKVGRDIYDALAKRHRAHYKKKARQNAAPIDPHKNYRPSEVAAILNVSYDTAIRRMQKMKGAVDMGTEERRYKRGKKLLVISGKNLAAYLRNKSVE